MKKTLLVMLTVLLSLTASAAYRTFQVNGIYYEQTEAADDFVSVSYVPEGGSAYKGDIVIPASVTYGGKTYPVKNIGQWAFYGCTGLMSIVLPEGLETIGNSSFYGCTGLKGITLPSTLKFVKGANFSNETGAFEGCTGLKSVYFPPTMTTDELWTPNIAGFNHCTGLKTIFVAGGKTGISMYGAFEGCTAVTDFVAYIDNSEFLQSFYVDARNFESFSQTASLIVPDGMKTAYQNAREWYSFQHIYERSNYAKAFAVLTAGIGGKLTYSNDDIWRATQVYGVQKGQTVNVTITPDEGHRLLRLLKDGQDVTAQVSDGKYTVQNVQKDFTLEAVFEEGTTPDPQPGGGGTAKLSIEPFSIKAGETATMLIDMTNPDDEITALDFFLQLPEGLSIVMEDGEAAVDIAGRTTWKKHSLTVNTNDGHIMLYSSTNATLSGTSGAIISVKLTASGTFKGGDIRLTGQVLNTPVPVVSKPADYVYTLKTEEPVDLNLEMDVAILNAIDGTVYENEVRLRLTSDYKGEGSLQGYKFYYIYKILENGELKGTGGSRFSAWITGVTTSNYLDGDGQYKVEYGYESENGIQVVLGSTFFVCKPDDRYVTIVMEDGMRTYCNENDLDFSAVQGLKAYTVGGFNKSTNEALMMRVTDVPAETGLLLVGPPGAYLVSKSTSSTVYVNMLKGVVKSTTINRKDGNYFNYVFREGEDGVGFYLANSDTSVPGHEAYLQLSSGVASSRPIVNMIFDDTTAIGGPTPDGQPFDVYSLSGVLLRRGVTSLQQLPRGVYVVGGRKVVVK